jgi:aspartate/methionine/tyrosine aminotransferase
MVLPEKLVDPINRLQQNMFINAPTISQTAALKCWDDDTIVELEDHVKKYEKSRALILEELQKLPGLDPKNIAPADGGFYVYVDLGDSNVAPGKGSIAFCSTFLETHHVAFTPGVDFEDPSTQLGDRRFRISYAGGIDTAAQAMQRLELFWPEWLAMVKKASE